MTQWFQDLCNSEDLTTFLSVFLAGMLFAMVFCIIIVTLVR